MSRSAPLGRYPSPDAAQEEIYQLAASFPARCHAEEIGRSTEGRPLVALRVHGGNTDARKPRLLVTAQIHAVEYIGSYVARSVAKRLVVGAGKRDEGERLLGAADVWFVPLLNPDGAWRIWNRGGWSGLGKSRFTANGVDPNRNFPFATTSGWGGWNSASRRPGSPYYRGPHPLSEPECLALARLCKREHFCGAINFHSFGGVVFLPEPLGQDIARARAAFEVFQGGFQDRQPHLRYRPVPERASKTLGQLDPFLLNAFGTPSVTVEVGCPGRHLLDPRKTANFFWWANPTNPDPWAENDADATIHALGLLLDRMGGIPCRPAHPELAEQVV